MPTTPASSTSTSSSTSSAPTTSSSVSTSTPLTTAQYAALHVKEIAQPIKGTVDSKVYNAANKHRVYQTR